jgi:4-amino-4-deoxy-L-arabinose transferase-like glycosyltransferase
VLERLLATPRLALGSALLCIGAAQALFLADGAWPAGLPLFALGAVLVARAPASPPAPRAGVGRLTTLLGLLLVTGLGAALRVVRLGSVPPGLYVDETLIVFNAFHWRLAGAWSDLLGGTQHWLGSPDQDSNLYLAAASGIMGLFGDGFVGVKMISLLPGVASIPLTCWLGCQLGGRACGLAAALLLAVSQWAVGVSQAGFTASALVALQLTALACAAHAVRGQRGFALPAGLALGLAFYTYAAAPLVIFHGALWLVWEVLRSDRRRQTAEAAALCLGVAGVLILPYVASQVGEGVLLGRAAEMSALASEHPAALVARQTLAHLGMFNVRGDTYAAFTTPGWPQLDPITGVLFLVGAVVVVVSLRGWRQRLLVSWFGVCVLAGVLARSRDGAPYALRVATLAPWACLVAGLGAERLARGFAERPRLRVAAGASIAALLIGANAWILFVDGPSHTDRAAVTGSVETAIGRWLAARPDALPVLVHARTFEPVAAYRSGTEFAMANCCNWYDIRTSMVAIHVTAGVYAERPRRAIAPLRPAGDVDLIRGLPRAVDRPTTLVLPLALSPEAERRFAVSRGDVIRDDRGRPLAVALRVEPAPAARR